MKRLIAALFMIFALSALAYAPVDVDSQPCVETVQSDGTVLMSSIVACYGDE